MIISSPRIALGLVFLITLLVGYGTFHLFFLSGYRYKPQDLEIVQGELARVDVIKRMRSADSLQIWLRGGSLPYRGNSGYPGYYRKDLVGSLKPGTTIAIGTLRAERAKPRRWISGRKWIKIYSLSIKGTTAFSLDDYNRWLAQKEKVGRIIMPILFVLGIGSMVSAMRALRRGSSFD